MTTGNHVIQTSTKMKSKLPAHEVADVDIIWLGDSDQYSDNGCSRERVSTIGPSSENLCMLLGN